MTEQLLQDLFTAIAAHRLDLIRAAGLLAISSDEMNDAIVSRLDDPSTGQLAKIVDEMHEAATGSPLVERWARVVAAHVRKVERWSELNAECARSLAHQVTQLTRRADLALEDTTPHGLIADLADPEDP